MSVKSKKELKCLLMPSYPTTHSGTILAVHWKISRAKLFMHVLDELHANVTEQFSMEFYSTAGSTRICFHGSSPQMRKLENGYYQLVQEGEFREEPDYTALADKNSEIVVGDLVLGNNDILPLNDYRNFGNDSITTIVPALEKVPPGYHLIVQVLQLLVSFVQSHHTKFQ